MYACMHVCVCRYDTCNARLYTSIYIYIYIYVWHSRAPAWLGFHCLRVRKHAVHEWNKVTKCWGMSEARAAKVYDLDTAPIQ